MTLRLFLLFWFLSSSGVWAYEPISSPDSLRLTEAELPTQLRLEQLDDEIALFRLPNGAMAKTRGVVLDFEYQQQNANFFTLLYSGELFLNLGTSGRALEFTVDFGAGFLSTLEGDFLIERQNEEIRIHCLHGKGIVHSPHLSLPLRSGEGIRVVQGKFEPAKELNGTELRKGSNWYGMGHKWPLPPLFEKLLPEDVRVNTAVVLLNGMPVPQGGILRQKIYFSDLILGRIRLETTLLNRPSYQIPQVSLNGGESFEDLPPEDLIVLKLKAMEGHYDIVFRLREGERFFSVDHPPLKFEYSASSSREEVQAWLENLRRIYMSRQDQGFYELLRTSRTYSRRSLQLIRDASFQGSRSLRFTLQGLTELMGRIRVVVAWEKRESSDGISRESGSWNLDFSRRDDSRLVLVATSGDDPFLPEAVVADTRGPRITLPSRTVILGAQSVSLRVIVSDTVSSIQKLEVFRDTLASRASELLPTDGVFNENQEEFELRILPSERARRLILVATDTSGRKSFPTPITIRR